MRTHPTGREGIERSLPEPVVLWRGWLLVKMDDEAADARRNPVKTEPRSVLSGKTIEELAGGSPPAESRAG